MTRKDYIVLAEALKVDGPWDSPQAENARLVAISRVADALALDNPRFDRGKFLIAAGWPAILRGAGQTSIRFVALTH